MLRTIESSLDAAETLILSAFTACFPPSDIGEKSVDAQRNFTSGFIYCLMSTGKIEQKTHDILHSMYFEGMVREQAISFHIPEITAIPLIE